MAGHRDIPDEVVRNAQLCDHAHWREDRAGERGGSWGSVPPDQVRRLIGGALEAWQELGFALVQVEDDIPSAVVFGERDLAVIGMYKDRTEDETLPG